VFDAYKIDALDEREMGAGAAIGVLGYRIALLITGSAAFFMADRMPWTTVYLVIALLMVVGIAAAIWAPEPVLESGPPRSLTAAATEAFTDFFGRTGIGWGLLILLFVIFYQLPDRFGSAMVTPFLLQIGFSQTQIGAIQ